MWATKTDNDSMNMTIVVTLCTGVVYHMDEFHWGVMGIQTHKAHYFFLYNIKQQRPPPVWHTRWQPMQHPLLIVYTSTFWGRDVQLPHNARSNFYTTRRRKKGGKWGRGGREGGGWFGARRDEACQCLLFFDFLWDRWGDLDLERDFLADFLGVLERDLRERLGVRGEGDLGGETSQSGH